MTSNPPTAELFVRADTFGTGDQQHSIVQRLSDLREVGAVDDVDTNVWQSRVRVDSPETEGEARAIDRFRAFERWADRESVSLDPLFETYERYSAILDEEYEELVTPVVSLALVRNGELVEVAPHRDGEEVYTVQDCLEDIETWSDTEAVGETEPTEGTEPAAEEREEPSELVAN